MTFDGNQSHWRLFDKRKQAEAKAAIPGETFGILGAFLTPIEYTLHNPTGGAYVALLHPGPRPLIDHINPTNLQIAAHGEVIKSWEYALTRFLKQEDAMANFKASYLADLDDASKALVDDPVTGTMLYTIAQIRSIMKLAYGTLSPSDLNKLFTEATAPYVQGTDMRTYLSGQHLLFAELAASGEIFSVLTRTRYLISSLESCGSFLETTTFWENTNTTIALQIQNANVLSAALITAFAKQQGVTAGSRHSVNAALTIEDVTKMVKAGVAAGIAAAAKEADANCTTCNVKITGKNKAGKPLRYCARCYAKHKADRKAT
jgi:hypothetical protein